MLKKLKNEQEGFTIIEVMIVLVIAAVILLIVFLAVPALQRNSRNTQKKNVASNVLAASGEFSNNNNGSVPAPSVSTTSNSDADKVLKLVNTNQLITQLDIVKCTTAVCANQTPSADDRVILLTRAACFGNQAVQGSSDRQTALRFQVEGSGGSSVDSCQSSGL